MEKLTEINTFRVRIKYGFFHIIEQTKVKGTVVNRALPSLLGGSLAITHYSPFTIVTLVFPLSSSQIENTDSHYPIRVYM